MGDDSQVEDGPAHCLIVTPLKHQEAEHPKEKIYSRKSTKQTSKAKCELYR